MSFKPCHIWVKCNPINSQISTFALQNQKKFSIIKFKFYWVFLVPQKDFCIKLSLSWDSLSILNQFKLTNGYVEIFSATWKWVLKVRLQIVVSSTILQILLFYWRLSPWVSGFELSYRTVSLRSLCWRVWRYFEEV